MGKEGPQQRQKEKKMDEYQQTARDMLRFIEKSPTCFHAVANLEERLEQEGFHRLAETEDWGEDGEICSFLTKGSGTGKFFVTRNDSSLLAFQVPPIQKGDMRLPWKGFHIVLSHSDSPTFKVKERPEIRVEDQYVRLNTEKYGGMILSTWLDRPLSVAGRLVVKGEEGLQSRLVALDEDLLVIPNVAIHMNRDMNKGLEYNPQADMLPLFAGNDWQQGDFLKKTAAAAGVQAEDVLGHDLFLYVREPGRILGAKGEFVLSPRLDDLQCVYSSMTAFLKTEPSRYLGVCGVLDNEEVGSATRQGAGSDFLESSLRRLCEALGRTDGDYRRLTAGGFLISADNAHAVHPNHPEKADPTNRPYLNGGIVIKYQGSQKYTTDALSGARMKSICREAGVPFQTYANRSDIAGGSTLGNISNAHVSIASVDIGLPQLAMHSAVETAGSRDTEYAVRALGQFFQE